MAGPIDNADGSVSRRGLAGRSVVPGLRRKRAHGRSPNAGSTVDIRSRGARISAHRDMPPGYMALASHGGSCDHGCGDHCSRNKFKLGHSISPCGYEEPGVLAPLRRWRREPAIKGTIPHLYSTSREAGASCHHGFRRSPMKWVSFYGARLRRARADVETRAFDKRDDRRPPNCGGSARISEAP
jgi:hypothetical protein